jgi:GTP cyclohydrolase-4
LTALAQLLTADPPSVAVTHPPNRSPLVWSDTRIGTRCESASLTSAAEGSPRRSPGGLAPVLYACDVAQTSTRTREVSPLAADVQAREPDVRLRLSRVGVAGVEKVIRIRDELFSARIECFVELPPTQKGAHMSRFEEVVNETIGEIVLGQAPFRAETLARDIAELVRERQGAVRAEVRIAARYPEYKPAPLSGIETQEIYTLHGRALASERGTRRVVGVSATGMTACPCAQELVASRARARLLDDGFSEEQADRVFAHVPVATHNPRGLGTLCIGFREHCSVELEAATLLHIVEQSMSSEIYELMKRTDEVAVVEKAHRRPRFVEDCVREMLRGVLVTLPDLDGGSFVQARQENLETIHQHNVVAERHALLEDLRREAAGEPGAGGDVTLEEWLAAG